MGVDARMHFIPAQPISDTRLRELDYGLASTVRASFFGRFGEYICMSRMEEIPGAIEIHLAGRFYDEGYERGPLTSYIEVADWLEKELGADKVKIYYYGDSGGCEDAALFDKEARDELYAYYLENGRGPYQRFFGEGPKGCKLCIKPLVKCGGGAGDTFLSCLACKENFIRSSDGKLTRVDDFFKRNPTNDKYTGF